MIFDGKPTRDMTDDELRQLVKDGVAEDRHLDYKEMPYDARDPRATSELAKDVTAFANADGGYLVIGVKEDGERRAVEFVSVADPEGARKSMIARCLDRIEPRLNGLDVGVFEVDGKTVLVVHVPESDRKPLCARPDAEHHYFWRRYEDGNKIMSTAEIRECFEGDRVHRELVELRRESEEHRREHVISREAELEVNDNNLLQLQTQEKLLSHMERRFLAAVGDRPYYRLWATPIPVNKINLASRRTELLQLLRKPPSLRRASWDLTPVGNFRTTGTGLVCDRMDYRHLRLLWNGHVEFWNRADDLDFHWDEGFSGGPPYRFLFPLAIIEPVECFARLVAEVCRVGSYQGELLFGLGLYRIEGQRLIPGAPGTLGYRLGFSDVGPSRQEPFPDENLTTIPVAVQAEDLPDAVAWRLASGVYYRFGHTDEEIPFFDNEHRCTLDERPKEGAGSS